MSILNTTGYFIYNTTAGLFTGDIITSVEEPQLGNFEGKFAIELISNFLI